MYCTSIRNTLSSNYFYNTSEKLKVLFHSGRTDKNNGHKDTKNKSALGLYHWHDKKRPHKHIEIKGILQYKYYEDFKSNEDKIFVSPLINYNVIINVTNISSGLNSNYNVTTNALGEFSKELCPLDDNAKDGYDISIKIVMRDNGIVNISNCFTEYDDVKYTYFWESEVYKNFEDRTLDFGIINLSEKHEDMDACMNIYHWIKAGKEFYEKNTDFELGVVIVKWETDNTNGSHTTSNPDNPIIWLKDTEVINGITYKTSDQFDSYVILHEYGHYILTSMDKRPDSAGGSHNYFEPSSYVGTAYSEGWATFFALQTRNSSTFIDFSDDDGNYFGIEVEALTYFNTRYDNYVILTRRPVFDENARMEAFVCGAMWDLADDINDGDDTYCGGFAEVNSVVTSKKLNDAIEFYDAYISIAKDKKLVWSIFNQNHVAFDYEVPQVTISYNKIQNGTTLFTANATDNISVEKIEWYVDNVVVGEGSTYEFTNKPNGTYKIEVRAYDPEGMERGDEKRYDITHKNELRYYGYGKDELTFVNS